MIKFIETIVGTAVAAAVVLFVAYVLVASQGFVDQVACEIGVNDSVACQIQKTLNQ